MLSIHELLTLNLIMASLILFVPAHIFKFLYMVPGDEAVTSFDVPLRASTLKAISFSLSLPVMLISYIPSSGGVNAYVTDVLAIRDLSYVSDFAMLSKGSNVDTPPPPLLPLLGLPPPPVVVVPRTQRC